jgi:cytochrome P450
MSQILDAAKWAKTFHVYQPELQDDPYEHFAQLRQHCPVARSDEAGGFWVISKFADVVHVLQNPDVFSSEQVIIPDLTDIYGIMIPEQIDPPNHAKYRKLLGARFSPATARSMEPFARSVAQEVAAGLAGRERIDFVSDFAVPFVCRIFCALMDLPIKDAPTFVKWKDAIFKHGYSMEPDSLAILEDVRKKVGEYFLSVIRARRHSGDLGDDPITSLLSGMVDGIPLTDDEILNACQLLFTAGLDTTAAQLALNALYLADNPAQRDRLVSEPEIIPRAMEELLRYETQVSVGRKVKSDVTLGGVDIPAGDVVMVLLGSADRDEDQFPNADRVDFDRTPNLHISFGAGPHRCLGSHLARMQLVVATDEFHKVIPRYSRDERRPVQCHLGYMRGVDSLPLRLG